jgi:hypothetical protein
MSITVWFLTLGIVFSLGFHLGHRLGSEDAEHR